MSGIACAARGCIVAALGRQIITVGTFPGSGDAINGYSNLVTPYGAINDAALNGYTLNQLQTQVSGSDTYIHIGVYPDNAPSNLFSRVYIERNNVMVLLCETASVTDFQPSVADGLGGFRSVWAWVPRTPAADVGWKAANIGQNYKVHFA